MYSREQQDRGKWKRGDSQSGALGNRSGDGVSRLNAGEPSEQGTTAEAEPPGGGSSSEHRRVRVRPQGRIAPLSTIPLRLEINTGGRLVTGKIGTGPPPGHGKRQVSWGCPETPGRSSTAVRLAGNSAGRESGGEGSIPSTARRQPCLAEQIGRASCRERV